VGCALTVCLSALGLILLSSAMVYCQVNYVVMPNDLPPTPVRIRIPQRLLLTAFACYTVVGLLAYGVVCGGTQALSGSMTTTYTSGFTAGILAELLTFGTLLESREEIRAQG
jgi:hypothetical protein